MFALVATAYRERSPDSARGIVTYRERVSVTIADWLCETRYQAERKPITAALFRLLYILCMCYTRSDYRMILEKQPVHTIDPLRCAST